MNKYIKIILKKLKIYKSKENSVIAIIGSDITPITVCEIVNGKPKVTRKDDEDTIVFILRYSLFHRVVKRYDKKNFKELQ